MECLLQSSSISPFIKDVQRNPRLVISTDEHILVPESKFDIELFREIIRDSYAQSTSDRSSRSVRNQIIIKVIKPERKDTTRKVRMIPLYYNILLFFKITLDR